MAQLRKPMPNYAVGGQAAAGDNLFPNGQSQAELGGVGQPDFSKAVYRNPGQSGAELAPGGMPGSAGNPNTGFGGGQPPQAPVPNIPNPPIVQNAGLPGGTAGPGPEQAPAPKYGAIQGFDLGKLSGTTPFDSKDKYSDAVRTFSQFLGSGGGIGRDNLGGAVDWAHQHGFGNARAVGDDKIDFGDGAGPIDVINSKGEVWFQNGPDRFGGGGSPMPTTGDFAPNTPWKTDMNFQSAAGPAPGTGANSNDTYNQMRQKMIEAGLPDPGPGAVKSAGAGVQPGPKPQPVIDRAPAAEPGGVRGPDVDQPGTGTQQPSSTRLNLDKVLEGLMSGQMNQDILNSRVDQARGVLDKQRKSAVSGLGAQLGALGQGANDGTFGQTLGQLDNSLGDSFANTVQGIYGDEAARADDRMVKGLSTAAGLSIADAQNLVDQFNAKTGRQNADTNRFSAENDFTLGKEANANNRYATDTNNATNRYGIDVGARTAADTNATNRYGIDANASVGHERNAIDRILGEMGIGVQNRGMDIQQMGQQLQNSQFLARFGLDRDQQEFNQQNGGIDQMIALLQQLYGGAGIGAGGYV